MKKFYLFVFLLLVVLATNAQKNDDAPAWIKNVPKAANNTYIYRVESAGGENPSQARNRALAKIVLDIMNYSAGVIYNAADVEKVTLNDTSFMQVAKTYNIRYNKVCEYMERFDKKDGKTGFVVWVLCQCPKRLNAAIDFTEFDGCTDTKNFKRGAAVALSVFIPGAGQMYMRHYGSGACTLLGEMALVGGGVGCYFMAQKQLNVLNDFNTDFTTYMNAKKTYNTLRIASISCYSAAGILYLYNIIRAATIKPKYKNKKHVALYPTLLPTLDDTAMGVGISFNINK